MKRGIQNDIQLLEVYSSFDKAISSIQKLGYTLSEAKILFERLWLKKEFFIEKD